MTALARRTKQWLPLTRTRVKASWPCKAAPPRTSQEAASTHGVLISVPTRTTTLRRSLLTSPSTVERDEATHTSHSVLGTQAELQSAASCCDRDCHKAPYRDRHRVRYTVRRPDPHRDRHRVRYMLPHQALYIDRRPDRYKVRRQGQYTCHPQGPCKDPHQVRYTLHRPDRYTHHPQGPCRGHPRGPCIDPLAKYCLA
jgi:hypothetical protein